MSDSEYLNFGNKDKNEFFDKCIEILYDIMGQTKWVHKNYTQRGSARPPKAINESRLSESSK